ncbi:IDC1 protein [Neurospora intermedia]|uniref:IDC1 protein n=1 Tax=Neurospora intermedia TaxID=5142 RepID=A0ABR3DDN1_NEUIN
MSVPGHISRSRTGSIPASSKGRTAHMQDFAMAPTPSAVPRYFEPCAATASMFLYAQGSSIVCCHHDSLSIERRFARHTEEVQLLAVDNLSEMGTGRLVVSYDAGQTAIVWDLMTGDEVARFASYENLTCAAWMHNGNVAFGNIQGNVILFEPTTSEHISARTIDQIAITAIAPAADCRTFAIGYQNGSLLIATLQPRFTILHNLTTSRGPSPIVTLAWHASSSRQKSDMLAVQTHDGDLRVWSVSKQYNADDPAKVVRILKRTENYLTGPNWMGWSKNGRIIQYSEGETISWDVRTKHVTYDTIPTLEHARGLAVYGPGATLFTLGANNSVQQFDLNAPAMMVNNVQHPANMLPPSPPISLEEQEKSQTVMHHNADHGVPIAIHADLSESDDHMSPLARLVQGQSEPDRYRPTSPTSSRSRSSVSITSSNSNTQGRNQYAPSAVSRGMTENTYISAGSSLRTGLPGQDHRYRRDRESLSTTSSVSMGSSNYRSRRPSRLRHEVPRSPDDAKVVDLFKFTKSRLQDMPYKTPQINDGVRLTNDDLRRQMLSTIFGWNKEIEDLIRDEMSRHPLGSTNRILLAKWLGDITTDIMAMGSENMTSSDWMLLALSGIGGQASQHKLGRAYVQRLLESGDVHAAATIMIGLGDHNDAIEIYVSHKKYMEALILTCLFFPSTWERQVQIARKWGEWAVQHGQQQLAIRCFACTGHESTEPWTSPSAQQITFGSISATVNKVTSPPLSPPARNHGPQRSVAKNSALKLITTFGDNKSKFFSGHDDGRTPIAAGATPIVQSALSPGGADPTTAVLRNNRSQFNTPSSARPPNGGFGRHRLPSIGEATHDNRELLTAISKPVGDPYANIMSFEVSDNRTPGYDLPRAQTASPRVFKDAKAPPPPSPSPAAVAALMEGRQRRNGSRSRIPEGLDLSLPVHNDTRHDEPSSPEQSGNSISNAQYHWPSRRKGPGSVASSATSASATSSVRGYRSHVPGKSMDKYYHSLEAAGSSRNARGTSRDGHGNGRDTSRSRRNDGDLSRDRGRGSSRGYTPKGGKRSPKSPVPMSPEDLINLATPREDLEQLGHGKGRLIDFSDEQDQPSVAKKVNTRRETSRVRMASRGASRNDRSSSRARSSERRKPPALDLRSREASREGSRQRSPSSPVPMSGQAAHFYGSEDEEDYRRALEDREKFRQRHNRSVSKNGRGESITSPISGRGHDWGGRERSTSRQRSDKRSESHQTDRRQRIPVPMPTPAPMQLVTDSSGDLKVMMNERQLKKEQAQRELEERRRSLARRPSAPPILHPDELTPARLDTVMELPSTVFVPPRREDMPARSASVDPSSQGAGRSMYANRGPSIGLPATPKAMRLVLGSDASRNNVPVPAIPANFQQTSAASSNQASPDKVPQRQVELKQQEVEPPMKSPAMLLPSTVYTPPTSAFNRPFIQRSMSAPPQDLVPPQAGALSNLRGFHAQQPSVGGEPKPMMGRRPSHDAGRNDGPIPPPPPPPPAPPMLRELQHLAAPPPPPPAPLPHLAGAKPVVYGGSSGMIEIVMDDDQPQQPPQQPQQQPPPPPMLLPSTSYTPVNTAPIPKEIVVPILSPPAPSSRNGHARGRSSIDHSIGGRISRVTERMRSASRSRGAMRDNQAAPMIPAPYESVPMPGMSQSMNVHMRAAAAAAAAQQQPGQSDFKTGLHHSEMI